jgi:hypothetical protein
VPCLCTVTLRNTKCHIYVLLLSVTISAMYPTQVNKESLCGIWKIKFEHSGFSNRSHFQDKLPFMDLRIAREMQISWQRGSLRFQQPMTVYIWHYTKVYHHLKNPIKAPVMCQFSPVAIWRQRHESSDNSQISNVERWILRHGFLGKVYSSAQNRRP